VAKSCLSTRGYRDGGKDWHRLLLCLVLFYVDDSSSSARSGRIIFGIEYLVPQSFVAGGNRVVSRILGCNRRHEVHEVQDLDSKPIAIKIMTKL
jgi:hypothetical protein